jgi:hypothetical protein
MLEDRPYGLPHPYFLEKKLDLYAVSPTMWDADRPKPPSSTACGVITDYLLINLSDTIYNNIECQLTSQE